MLTAWRLSRSDYAPTALTGEGSARYPGRWNQRGDHVVYLSEHLSLAVLEILAHAENLETLNSYVAIRLRLPQDSLITVKNLPDDWQANPAKKSTRARGHEWFSHKESLLLQVPSVLIPIEHNFLLNPRHHGFKDVQVDKPIPLPFDARILDLYT